MLFGHDRLKAYQVEHEIPHALEDRLALIELDAFEEMMMMPEYRRGAGIDCSASIGNLVIGQHIGERESPQCILTITTSARLRNFLIATVRYSRSSGYGNVRMCGCAPGSKL